MRAITGWRFLLVIALPIFLASLGVILLAYDLLDRVSAITNEAEHNRNRDIITRALKASEAEIGQFTRDNANWDVAFEHMYPVPDRKWVQSTWGKFNALGTAYDAMAIIERGNPSPLFASHRRTALGADLDRYLGKAYAAMMAKMPVDGNASALATSFTLTPDGPAIIALSPIVPETANLARAGHKPSYLLIVRRLSQQQFGALEVKYLISGLQIDHAGDANATGVVVKDAANEPVFNITWLDRRTGDVATASAWLKARAVLGFLILVMTGIALVCWRLMQNLVKSEQKARHDALHDGLTELPNRAALVESIRALHADKQFHMTLAFADLDGFKEVNDSYGHDLGDRLIRAVAAGTIALAGTAHLVCRMGGDEFVVLFTGASSQADAKEFAARMIQFLAEPFDMEGRIAAVGVSVGIASSYGEDLDELEMLRRADIAMYRAKADGKNRWCVYDEAFDAERAEALSIAAELKEIIAGGSLDIAFQPVIDAHASHMSGVEALARWPKSSGRSVAADKFVAIAETAGLVDDLGSLVLDKACSAARHWPGLRLAVNISAVQLNNPRFVERALAVLAKHGVNPARIEFEITETSLIHDTDLAKEVFKQLQRAGIKVALDDFGTGFSSIGYLRTFNFDRIKIDKSIVSKVLSNPAELAIVQGTLLVARGLSADVTAEGVSSEEEAAVLRLAGCTELQGYYFHKPLPAAQITALLESAGNNQPRRAVAW